jgi:hypothetical protein
MAEHNLGANTAIAVLATPAYGAWIAFAAGLEAAGSLA